jgi:hypothetical protein
MPKGDSSEGPKAPVNRANDTMRITNVSGSDDPRMSLIQHALAVPGSTTHGREQGSPNGPIPDEPGVSFSTSAFEKHYGFPHTDLMEQPAEKPKPEKAKPTAKKKDDSEVRRTPAGPFAGWSRQDHIDYRTKNASARAANGSSKPQPKKKAEPKDRKPSKADFDKLMGES